MFALLRAGLWGQLPEEALFETVSFEEWKELFTLAGDNKVTALCCDGIERLPQQCRPPRGIWIPWVAERQKVEERYQHQLRVLGELENLFEPQGIRTLVLKGAAVGSYYPIPKHRQFDDLDLYHWGKWKEADALVSQQLGVKVSNDAYHHTKYDYLGVTIENHYTFVNCRNQRSDKDYERLLVAQLGESYNPTFEALFLMRHMSGHFASSRITVRNLTDWLMFVERYRDCVDWEKISDVFNHYVMTPFVGTVHAILEDELGLQPVPHLHRNPDEKLNHRVLCDILYGEFAEMQHSQENLGRVFWKLRRYRANRWKHQICYSDPWLSSFCRGIFAHMLKPRSIIHKM